MKKKVLSVLLAGALAASVMATTALTAGAVKTEHSKYVPGSDVPTYKYYFAMPGSWLNDSTKDNNDAAGCYWWEATDSPGDRFDNGWPGYECDKETGEADVPNLFSIRAPQDATTILWNNYLDGGMDKSQPVFDDAKQVGNKNAENYTWGDAPTYSDAFWTFVYKTAADQLGLDIAEKDIEKRTKDINEAAMDDPEAVDFSKVFGDKYGKNFYVDEEINEGLAMRFENMVYVVDLEKVSIDYTMVPEGKLQFGGEFYFYYGNGEYGMWPTKELAKEHEGADYFEQDADGNYTKANKYGVVLNEDGQVVIGNFTGPYWAEKKVDIPTPDEVPTTAPANTPTNGEGSTTGNDSSVPAPSSDDAQSSTNAAGSSTDDSANGGDSSDGGKIDTTGNDAVQTGATSFAIVILAIALGGVGVAYFRKRIEG